LAIFGIFIFSGCKKNETQETQETLEAYIKRAGITDAIKDSRGFYYKILTEGTGVNPTVSSKVTIYYKGTLTNGSIFDQTGAAPATFNLNQLILGWQYGLPLIKPGGKILLWAMDLLL
jgi:FKBP-type peptidyl-prolyl cis-trans isomerase FkpA